VNRATATLRATAALAATALVALGVWLTTALTALAASPSPAAPGGDPRSSGQGPGLVGDPAFALLAVVAIGLGSVVATLAYVRLTGRRDA
jgi:hypothetical protein